MRTVEFAGEARKITLRRHVVLTFHVTPMGPHRSRDRTIVAIRDAGCWRPVRVRTSEPFVEIVFYVGALKTAPYSRDISAAGSMTVHFCM